MHIPGKKSCVFIMLLLAVCLMGGYKVYQHEKNQNSRIQQLQVAVQEKSQSMQALEGRTDYLEKRLEQVTDYYNVQPEYRDNVYNYLAIGNSLTLIMSWGRGICATQPNSDYYGLVKKHMLNEYGDVAAYRMNFASWERMQNREQALNLLDMLLSDKLNLITIQLGENVTDTSHYESDLEGLIDYVQKRAPKAKIIVIGDFWDVKRNEMRKEAAQNKNVAFADLSDIIGDKDYQSREGTPCTLDDGSVITVSKEAATHPNDRGMEYIANKIVEQVN